MQAALPGRGNPAHTDNSRHRLLRFVYHFYKAAVSPVLEAIAPSRCLYLPTCSEYAYTAIHRFGVVRGSWMAARRFSRCLPWGKGGHDPVPERLSTSTADPTASSSSNAGSKRGDHLP